MNTKFNNLQVHEKKQTNKYKQIKNKYLNPVKIVQKNKNLMKHTCLP